MTAATPTAESLRVMLRSLRLPGFASHCEEVSKRATREGWTFVAFLHELASLELQERRRRRVARNLKASRLPTTKTLATLKLKRLPAAVRTQVSALCAGDFLRKGTNVLAFGLPGRSKSHTLAAIGHELVHCGYRVLFTPTFQLVQRLLAAKRDLLLEAELKRLDGFDAVILDSCGASSNVELKVQGGRSRAILAPMLHITRDSEGLEPVQDGGIAPPCGLASTVSDGLGFLERSPLRFKIDRCIPVGRFDTRVSEPVADRHKINARL